MYPFNYNDEDIDLRPTLPEEFHGRFDAILYCHDIHPDTHMRVKFFKVMEKNSVIGIELLQEIKTEAIKDGERFIVIVSPEELEKSIALGFEEERGMMMYLQMRGIV